MAVGLGQDIRQALGGRGPQLKRQTAGGAGWTLATSATGASQHQAPVRSVSVDVLKLCMALVIVGLHCNVLADVSPLVGHLMLDGVCRMGVPVFLVINGYFFAASIGTASQLKRWVGRHAMLYVAWMIIYFPLWRYWLGDPDPVLLGVRLLSGYFHLWYLPGLIGAGLLLFALACLPRRYMPTIVAVIALALYAVSAAIQYASLYQACSGAWCEIIGAEELRRNFLLFSFPFLALGALIRWKDLDRKVSTNTAMIVTVVGLLALLGESYVIFTTAAHREPSATLVTLPIVVPALFILVKRMTLPADRRATSTGRALDGKEIALFANGVFFTQVMFCYLFGTKLHLNDYPTVFTLVVAVASMLTSAVLVKMPFTARWLL